MLSPKRTKFRKAHKGRIHGMAKGGTQLNFGAYGLKAVTPERVTARQIEAACQTKVVVHLEHFPTAMREPHYGTTAALAYTSTP